MKEEKVNKIINGFRGETAPGTGFNTTSKWTLKNDKIVFDTLDDKIRQCCLSGVIAKDEIKSFENGKWIVSYEFLVDPYDRYIEYSIGATRDCFIYPNPLVYVKGLIRNSDLLENNVELPLDKYLKMLKI